MSRKSRTILTISVRCAVPPGWTQKQTLGTIELAVKGIQPPFAAQEVLVRTLSRETVYI